MRSNKYKEKQKKARTCIHREVLQHGQAAQVSHRHLGPQVVRLEQRRAVAADGQLDQPAACGAIMNKGWRGWVARPGG